MKNFKIYKFLFEEKQESKDAPEKRVNLLSKGFKSGRSKDSVDDQIDGLILRYEKLSIRKEEEQDSLLEILNNQTLKFLFEQEDPPATEDPPPAEDAPASEETPAGEDADSPEDDNTEPEGSEKASKDVAKNESIPDLNIDAFTTRAARLITNHRNLLSIEEVIVNRIKNFLDEHYGDAYVSEFLSILDKNYGIQTSPYLENYEEHPDEDFAIGANPAGAGSVGGAG